jgi:hypothetical protein
MCLQAVEKNNTSESLISRIKTKFDSEKKEIFFCIIITFVLGLIAHAFAFFTPSYSHDSLKAVFATHDELKWKVELGRFVVPIYYSLFRGKIAIPWLIGVIGLSFLSVAVYLVKKIFDVKSKIVMILVAGIMVANRTIISQIGTYLYEFDFNMLSLLLAVAATYFWKKHYGVKGRILSVIFLFLSMGIYQSYASVFITFVMFELMFMLLNNENIKKVFKKAAAGVIIVCCAFVLYLIVSKIACFIAGVSLQERVEVFVKGVGLKQIILSIAKTYWFYAGVLISHGIYGNFFVVIVSAVVLIAGIILCPYIFKSDRLKLSNRISTIGLICFLPLGINSINVISRSYLHDLMKYSIWMTYVLFVMLIYKYAGEIYKNQTVKKFVRLTGVFLLVAVVWKNIVVSNTLYLKKDIEAKSTFSIMTRVVAEMEHFDEYEMGITEVAFIGVANNDKHVDGFENVSSILGSCSSNSISQDSSKRYYNAYRAYFEFVLNYPIRLSHYEKQQSLKNNSAVESMPAFPEKGYIQYIDGVMVVKLEK